MADLVRTVAVALPQLFSPLLIALQDEEEFSVFLRRFGFDFGPETLSSAVQNLASLPTGVRGIAAAAQDAMDDGLQATDVQAILSSAVPLFSAVQSLFSTLQGVVSAGTTPPAFAASLETLPQELLDLLLADYLNARFPLAMHVLNLLDVYRPQSIEEDERGVTYIRHVFDWSRISLLFDDPEAWARESYDWGVDLDTETLIWRLSRTFEFIGGIVNVDDMTPTEVAAFQPDWPLPNAPPSIARAPVIRKIVTTANGTVNAAASGEAGVALFAVSGNTPASGPTDKGIGLAPYLDGSAGASADFGGGVTARVTGGLGAVGGIVFALRPSGVEVKTGIDAAAFSGAFAIELVKLPVGGAPVITLIGNPGESRIEATAIVASFGGELSNLGSDLYVAGGVRNLKAIIDPGDDGLLSSLIPNPIEITAGDILLGWRSGRGLYFEGGSNLTILVPLNLDLGPISIDALSVTIDWREPPSVTVAVTGDVTLGPFYAFAEGIGLKATIVEDPDGMLGDHDLRFSFKPPSAYALSLDGGPISGGGLLAVYDHEYRGALALKFESIGFSAFAILNTRLPNGNDGFSLAASIFGEFNLPLGYGFFLTGLGGIIGVNRTIDTNALRDVLFEGRLDNLLFPADPIASASTILADMAAILPPREGHHLLGPVARIAWGAPVILEVKLGVVIEIGSHIRVLVLGGVASNLPTKDTALVSLTMAFFGEIDFAAGTISFDATLTGSRVLAWTVEGDAAFRTGWAPRIDHIAAIGGLHPDYPRPTNLPDLRRLTINFGTNNPKVTLTAYLAVTLNTLQFGARADLYAKGPHITFVGRLAAEGNVYLDALVYFNPFGFDAKLGGSLTLLVDGDTICGLGFDVRLKGPNPYRVSGKVWVTVFGIDVDFHITHRWGEEQSLPPAQVDGVAVLREAIERRPTLEPVPPSRRVSGVSLAPSKDAEGVIDPAGGARFMQRAVPLEIALDKIGEAQVSGPKLLDLKAFAGSTELILEPAEEEFVRGHFIELSEAERLRAPGFERFKAGFELSPDILVVDPGKAIVEDYAYEVILLGIEDDRTRPADLKTHAALAATFAGRWATVNDRRVGRPPEGFRAARAADAIVVQPPRFVGDAIASDLLSDAARPRADAIAILETARSTFTVAASREAAIRVPAEGNRVVADYIAAAQL